MATFTTTHGDLTDDQIRELTGPDDDCVELATVVTFGSVWRVVLTADETRFVATLYEAGGIPNVRRRTIIYRFSDPRDTASAWAAALQMVVDYSVAVVTHAELDRR